LKDKIYPQGSIYPRLRTDGIWQPNDLERDIKKKLGGKQGAKQKSVGAME